MTLASTFSGRRVLSAFVLLVGTASVASAQAQSGMKAWTDRGFVNVNFGQQTKARQAIVEGSFPLYDEVATFDTSASVNAATIFDIQGGVRLWRNLAAGVGFSKYSDPGSAAVSASIPDPVFFDSPHGGNVTVDDLEHSETGLHLSGIWMIPVVDKLDIAVFGGLSMISLKKDLATGITVPTGGTTVSGVTETRVEESATGGHFGFDIRYIVFRQQRMSIGVGAFGRFASAKVDVPAVTGGTIELGGLNYGAGVRIGF
jgi:hypothetical protein